MLSKKTLLFKSRRESCIVITSEHKQMKIFFFSIGMRNKKIIFPMKHKCCEKKSLLFKSRRESCIQTNKNIFFSIGMRNKKIIFQ